MMLSRIGDICRGELLAIPERWPGLDLDSWVIMPDHLHFILFLRRRLPEGIPQVVAGFKSGVSRLVGREYPELVPPFWQRGFHDRVLRSSGALDRARRYIALNPTRWG
jgi:REP element-mobilizing transposase RayT